METLVEHYRQHELPDMVHGTRPLGSHAGEDETRKSFSTQTTYQGYLRKVDSSALAVLQLVGRESQSRLKQWLKSLPVSRGTKAKIRNIMSALYSHAQRWEWTTYQSHHSRAAEREAFSIPTVLTPQQLKELSGEPGRPGKDGSAARCIDRPAGRRIARPEVGGH